MELLSQQDLDYIADASGIPVDYQLIEDPVIPHYLKQQYGLCSLRVGNRTVLGVVLLDNSNFRPATFEKHLTKILQAVGYTDGYCLIARDLPSYIRQRLMQRGISFVVPDYQLYWPELGLALKRRQPQAPLGAVEKLSPATQAVVIGGLLGTIDGPTTAKALSQQLGYTTMTLSRALNEIAACDLADVTKQGRERLLVFPVNKRVLWEKALPYLQSPVQDTVRLHRDDLPPEIQIVAGETALAKRGMLVAPKEPCYAIGKAEWKKLKDDIKLMPIEDEDSCLVQVWKYPPVLFANEHGVDKFSLYLSLKDEYDERVQQALDDVMEGWT